MYPHTYPFLAPQPGADVLRIRIMFLHSPKRPRDDCLANGFRCRRCLVLIQIESQLSNSRKSTRVVRPLHDGPAADRVVRLRGRCADPSGRIIRSQDRMQSRYLLHSDQSGLVIKDKSPKPLLTVQDTDSTGKQQRKTFQSSCINAH